MEPQTKGYVERGILAQLVQHYGRNYAGGVDFGYTPTVLPTSVIMKRLRNDASSYDRRDIADSSIRRALAKLKERGLIQIVPKDELENEAHLELDQSNYPRDKFWKLAANGYLEVLILHHRFNRELAELYRQFGSGDWGHDPAGSIELSDIGSLDYSELQSIAKGIDGLDANQSGNELVNQIEAIRAE